MRHEIEVIDVQDRTALARQLIVDETALGQAIGSALGEEYDVIRSAGLRPLGAPFVVYRDRLPDQRWDVEICAPVAEAPETLPGSDLVVGQLPSGTVARTLHRGPYRTVGAVYDEMARWIGEHGYVPCGPPREIYLSELAVPDAQIETLIEMPVERAES